MLSKKHPFRKISLIISFAASLGVFTAGCGNLTGTRENASAPNSAKASPETGGKEDSSQNGKSGAVAGLCLNDYYPVNPEKIRNYKITGTAGADYSLTQSAVAADRFRETRKFDSGTSVITNWQCTDEGLRYVEYNSLITMPNAQMIMETVKSEGITLPKEYKIGSEWTNSFEIRMNMAGRPNGVPSTGTVTISNKLAALDEIVKTAGGEFKAARIDSKIKIDITAMGRKVPGMVTEISNWYSPEVGLVKQSAEGAFGKQNMEFTGNSN